MKKLILASFIAFVSATTFAQDKEVKKTERLSLGLKAGITFPAFAVSGGTTANDVTTSGLTSFYAGVLVNIPLGNILSIQPGVSLIGKGGSVKQSNVTTKTSPLYVEIPVNAVVGIEMGPGKVMIGAGPYYAFGVSGKVKVGDQAETDITFGTGATSTLKSTDWGVNFLLGYQLHNGIGLNVGYGVGLQNVQPDDSIKGTYKSGVFSAGISFLF